MSFSVDFGFFFLFVVYSLPYLTVFQKSGSTCICVQYYLFNLFVIADLRLVNHVFEPGLLCVFLRVMLLRRQRCYVCYVYSCIYFFLLCI